MDMKSININGYNTYFTESSDRAGKHLLISIPSDAPRSFADVCGTFINGHLIRMTDYVVSNGIRFLKAYY